MKILPNTNNWNLQTAVDLTPMCDSSILQINDDTFAFCAKEQKSPHLVIKSEIFALLMLRLEEKIVHFNVFRPRCLCYEGEGDVVIRLTECDGCVYRIDENENLELCMSIEDLYNAVYEKSFIENIMKKRNGEDPQIHEVVSIWKLPNRAPFDRMTVSNRAVELLSAHCQGKDPAEVLQSLWSDIETKIQKESRDVHVALDMAASVGDLTVVEHLCGRIAIYLPDEVPQKFRMG